MTKGRPDTRLYRFQLADDPSGGLGTSQMTAFTTQPAELYRAPEVFERPNVAKPTSDIFSLGALAWHVFTGRSPGTTLAEREALSQNHISRSRRPVMAWRPSLSRIKSPRSSKSSPVRPM